MTARPASPRAVSPKQRATRSLAIDMQMRKLETDTDRNALDLAIDNVAVPVDKAIPCGVSLSELLSFAVENRR